MGFRKTIAVYRRTEMQRQLLVARDGTKFYADADTVELVEMVCDLPDCSASLAVTKGQMTEAEIMALSVWVSVSRLVGANGQLVPILANYCSGLHAMKALDEENKAAVAAALNAPVSGIEPKPKKIDLEKLKELAGLN
jgi:hypothetical protein